MKTTPFLVLASLGLVIAVGCAPVATVAKPPAPPEKAPMAEVPPPVPAPDPVPQAVPKVDLPVPVILDGSALKHGKSGWELSGQGQVAVLQAAEWIRLHGSGFGVTVTGYSSKSGGSAQSLTASRHRAEFIAHGLVKAGIPPERIFVQARGDANPCASNATHAGRLKNERVEISFHGEGTSK